MKHTELPWRKTTTEGDDYNRADIVSGKKDIACMISILYGDKETRHEADEAEADAEFIVKACNSHYELLHACKVMHNTIGSSNNLLQSEFREINDLIKRTEVKS